MAPQYDLQRAFANIFSPASAGGTDTPPNHRLRSHAPSHACRASLACFAGVLRGSAQEVPVDSTHAAFAGRLLAEGLQIIRSVRDAHRADHPRRRAGSADRRALAAAVAVTREMMEKRGFDRVHTEKVMVPVWVRGPVREAENSR